MFENNLIIGAIGGLSFLLVPLLTTLFRRVLKAGILGFESQVKALVKDKRIKRQILSAIDEVEIVMATEVMERRVKAVANRIKSVIPGKLDDLVIDAVVRAVYEELRSLG